MRDYPLLSVAGMRIVFPHRKGDGIVVDDVSFQVDAGEILGFVGESGAGKSVTGAAIIGLLDHPGRLAGGEIHFRGQRVDGNAEAIRGRHVGMVFQDPLTALNPLRTIGDQLVETICRHLDLGTAAARQKALDGLAEVGIDPGRFDAYPHEFSGGMRQRVVIALALAGAPELVIADEPTTALDVSVQARILELLKSVCRDRGAAVILITHDMGVIAETTDRTAVFYAGRLVEIGPTAELLSTPRHPYTAGLIAATPSIHSGDVNTVLPQISGAMPKPDALPAGCAFHPRCSKRLARCAEARPVMTGGRVACWLYPEHVDGGTGTGTGEPGDAG